MSAPSWLAILQVGIFIGFLLFLLAWIVGLPMPWWSRARRLRYWTDELEDAEHYRERFGWADSPSERRERVEAIDRARRKVELYSGATSPVSGITDSEGDQ